MVQTPRGRIHLPELAERNHCGNCEVRNVREKGAECHGWLFARAHEKYIIAADSRTEAHKHSYCIVPSGIFIQDRVRNIASHL